MRSPMSRIYLVMEAFYDAPPKAAFSSREAADRCIAAGCEGGENDGTLEIVELELDPIGEVDLR